jgi:hypothetical protein
MDRASHICLKFTACGTTARARLLWDAAPQTCEAITKVLPARGASHHAIYSGSECVLLLEKTLRLDEENATSNVAKGQVAFAFIEKGSSYGVAEDITEVCWFYDIDSQPRMWEGPVKVNLFAEIEGPAEAFYSVCRRMRREGVKPFHIDVEGRS